MMVSIALSVLVSTISPLSINAFHSTDILEKRFVSESSREQVEAWQVPQRLLAVRDVLSRTKEARVDERLQIRGTIQTHW